MIKDRDWPVGDSQFTANNYHTVANICHQNCHSLFTDKFKIVFEDPDSRSDKQILIEMPTLNSE